jgi:hypothetical protein
MLWPPVCNAGETVQKLDVARTPCPHHECQLVDGYAGETPALLPLACSVPSFWTISSFQPGRGCTVGITPGSAEHSENSHTPKKPGPDKGEEFVWALWLRPIAMLRRGRLEGVAESFNPPEMLHPTLE